MKRIDATLDWHKKAAQEIYKNLLGYFKDYGLGHDNKPPILDIAYDIWKYDPVREEPSR